MQLTTLGASYSPLTAEGRVLSLLLAIFAFTLGGYVTAALASLSCSKTGSRGRSLSGVDPVTPAGTVIPRGGHRCADHA